MKSKAIFAVLAILLVFPAGLRAQHAGFVVGIGSGHVQTGQHTQPAQHGLVRTPHSHRIPGNGFVHRRGSAFPQRGSTFPQRGSVFPQRGSTFPRRGTAFPQHGMVVPRGAGVFVVGPYAVKNAPGHEPRTPTHPILVPGVTVVTPGTGRVVTGRRRGAPFGIQPGIRIIQPGIGPAIAVGARERHSGNPSVGDILRGTSRDEVIARFGRPKVQILNRNSETMIFGGTTIIIQNGVVALIR